MGPLWRFPFSFIWLPRLQGRNSAAFRGELAPRNSSGAGTRDEWRLTLDPKICWQRHYVKTGDSEPLTSYRPNNTCPIGCNCLACSSQTTQSLINYIRMVDIGCCASEFSAYFHRIESSRVPTPRRSECRKYFGGWRHRRDVAAAQFGRVSIQGVYPNY